MLLWEGSEAFKKRTTLVRYMRWLESEKSLSFSNYEDLWEWSVTEIEAFWESVWEYFEVRASKPYESVLAERKMPGASWFAGSELNYAEHILRNSRVGSPAIIHRSEVRGYGEMGWQELEEKTAALAAGLRNLGVGRGDRVVAYMPNVPEALIGLLAATSIGAVWSSCGPDFGAGSVVDRFRQIEPKVLLAVNGYRYGGKDYDRTDVVARLQREIPTLQKTVLLPYLESDPETDALRETVLWNDLLSGNQGMQLAFEQVPFDHPLWVLYSSGTTGLPKAIVQSQGGILIDHLKLNGLHTNLDPGARFFWFTTTGWMLWNLVASSMLSGATALLYDGNPGYPGMEVLWAFAGEAKATVFGTSATFITSCMKAGVQPARDHDLSRLRAIGSTGSPLPPEGFRWVYENVKEDIWLYSVSGGSDLCSAFVGGVPTLPVRAGEIQARVLGAKVEAYDEDGSSLIDEVGELVVKEPMPSMPLYLWGDEDGSRYRESYFEMYPGVWRHGDWIKIKENGSCVIYGRSDSTINRGGVRMGTSEIYSSVEKLEEVVDSLVTDIGSSTDLYVPLFVVLKEGVELDDELKRRIRHRVREDCSPRHVPDDIFAISAVPRTLTGKKLEVPVKKILSGTPSEEAASRDALSNPDSLAVFVRMATRKGKGMK